MFNVMSILLAFTLMFPYSVETNRYDALTEEQKDYNAEIIFNYLEFKGWSDDSICAVLGNMYMESGLNPRQWQGGYSGIGNEQQGFGLVQFTPSTKWTNYCAENDYWYGDIFIQLDAIDSNFNNQFADSVKGSIKITLDEFKENSYNRSINELTDDFMRHYERIADSSIDKRIEKANYYKGEVQEWRLNRKKNYLKQSTKSLVKKSQMN